MSILKKNKPNYSTKKKLLIFKFCCITNPILFFKKNTLFLFKEDINDLTFTT